MPLLGRHISVGKADKHLLVLMFLTFAVFIASVTIAVTSTASHINAADSERTRVAINVAVDREVSDIARYVSDNALWDDAALAVYRPKIDQDFIDSSLDSATDQQSYFDRVIIVDHSGKALLAEREGQHVHYDTDGALARAVTALGTQIGTGDKPASAITRDSEGLLLVGVSNIIPTSERYQTLVPTAGPHRLIMARRFSQSRVADIQRALQLPQMRLAPPKQDELSLPVTGLDGKEIAKISWPEPQSGWTMLKGSLPWLIGAAILHLALASALHWRGFKLMNSLGEQATIDSLSGLPNRRALQNRLTRGLARHDAIALAFLDLDGFKAVNDNYGHDVGDAVIRHCADHLRRFENRYVMVARLGGDEFAIIGTGPDCKAEIQSIADAVLAHLAEPIRVGERTIRVGTSIGIADDVAHSHSVGELMRRADLAMYAAKAAGKMRVMWFDPAMDDRQAEAHEIEEDMRTALETDGFHVQYQTLVAASGEPIVGVEALLRWDRGEGKPPIGPAEFIPIAEESGLIDRLGLFVLRKACSDALAWPDLQLSVNISVAQLRNPEFPALVRRALEEVGFPARRLELEVTETFLVHDPALAIRILAEIREMGVRVALDDFGTGFASIGFLRQFDFQKLKIDRTLVTEAVESDASRAMLNASISVAHALGMSIVAEGVETQSQADMMRVAGCQELQGWHFSKAVDADEISKQLAGYAANAAVNAA